MDIEDAKPHIPVDCFKPSNQSTGSSNRINHVVAFHNKRLIIVGGIPTLTVSGSEEHHRMVHSFSFETKTWSKKDYVAASSTTQNNPPPESKDD